MIAAGQVIVPGAGDLLTRYEPLDGKPGAVLVDLDGTTALHVEGGRSPYDDMRCEEDLPNHAVLITVRALAAAGWRVIFLSGRRERSREATERWLAEHYGRPYEALFMRPAHREGVVDWRVKAELFNLYIRLNYRVLAVFDDRNQVVSMWRMLGLTVFQVAEGDF